MAEEPNHPTPPPFDPPGPGPTADPPSSPRPPSTPPPGGPPPAGGAPRSGGLPGWLIVLLIVALVGGGVGGALVLTSDDDGDTEVAADETTTSTEAEETTTTTSGPLSEAEYSRQLNELCREHAITSVPDAESVDYDGFVAGLETGSDEFGTAIEALDTLVPPPSMAADHDVLRDALVTIRDATGAILDATIFEDFVNAFDALATTSVDLGPEIADLDLGKVDNCELEAADVGDSDIPTLADTVAISLLPSGGSAVESVFEADLVCLKDELFALSARDGWNAALRSMKPAEAKAAGPTFQECLAFSTVWAVQLAIEDREELAGDSSRMGCMGVEMAKQHGWVEQLQIGPVFEFPEDLFQEALAAC